MLPVHSAPTVPAGAGRRACPPEDCGGTWGYRELCEILADPARPEHDERPELIGRPFDEGRGGGQGAREPSGVTAAPSGRT